MANERNPRPTDKPNWIPDDASGIVTPPGSKQNTGWLAEEKPPYQFFNWFWNRLTQIVDFVMPRADKYNIIIDTDVDEGDYDTLAAYLADAPVLGDRVFIKVDEALLVQTIIPAGITLHQLAGKKFTCAVNIVTSIFQFGDDVVIEGSLHLETTQAGVTAIAFELDGDSNYLQSLILENSGAGTITDAIHINVDKESNYARGVINNTGAGAITNPLVDASVVDTNDIIIKEVGGELNRSIGASTFNILIVDNLTVNDLTATSLSTDTINEETLDAGVNIEGVNIKDGEVEGVLLDAGNVDSAGLKECIVPNVIGVPVADTLYNQSMVKGWVNATGAAPPVIQESYNVTGVVRNSVGNYTVSWDKVFASTSYCCIITIDRGVGAAVSCYITAQGPGSVVIKTVDIVGGLVDVEFLHVMVIGAQ